MHENGAFQANFKKQYRDGEQKTTKQTIHTLKRIYMKNNTAFIDQLDKTGVKTRIINGTFLAEYVHKGERGLAGTITRTTVDAIWSSVTAGYMPILDSLATSAEGTILYTDTEASSAKLASALRPRRMIHIGESSRILDGHDTDKGSRGRYDSGLFATQTAPVDETCTKTIGIQELLKNLPQTTESTALLAGSLLNAIITNPSQHGSKRGGEGNIWPNAEMHTGYIHRECTGN
ncbi:hypothetical protein E8E14_010109 [Neopestalotiopsis sp. 37M]|nr:hypothetical protein E8E14_010109 [Neopestalotiopsis sp. 37M]